jgi:non-specific protein-tyrosine kinase
MVEVLKAFKNPVEGSQQPLSDRETDSVKASESKVRVTNAGWVSPHYSISKTVDLDLRIAEMNRCVGLLSDGQDCEYFKLLRTQIRQKMEKQGWNSLMITSVGPGEGKTTTAINLAAMFAKEYAQTVMLIDADFHQQSIHRYLGYEQNEGLVEHLLENVPLQDVITWPGIEKLTIISGGRTLMEGAELLNSPRMRDLVREMKQRYSDRYIFFDVPPLMVGADALSFAPVVDAVLVVVEAGKTPMPELQKALALLPKEKVLGLVMNRKN